MDKRIKVLIADDHVHEVMGFKSLLSLVSTIEVVGVATSAKEAIQKALDLQPDVVLLDLAWYKNFAAGISVIRSIKSQAPYIKILAATVYNELIDKARVAGADIAVDKDLLSNTRMLVDRIVDAYESEAFTEHESSQKTSLTSRESEVLILVARGHTDPEIAKKLNIKASTAKKHVSSILNKLGVNSRTRATAVAYERSLIPKQTN